MMRRGLLNLDGSPTPLLLDAVRFSETGHLSDNKANNAVSRAGAIGAYQFMPKYLHDMGYGMPKNIPVSAVKNPQSARKLAGQYIGGVNRHHNYTNPVHSLAAYNWGAGNVDKWIKKGADFNKLPKETQDYINRAMGYVQNQQGSNDMASPHNNSLWSVTPTKTARAGVNKNVVASQHYSPFWNKHNVSGAPTVAAPPALAMPTEDDPNVNIDDTPVDKSAILNQIMQALKTGTNAQPKQQLGYDGGLNAALHQTTLAPVIPSNIQTPAPVLGEDPAGGLNSDEELVFSVKDGPLASKAVLQDQGTRAGDATSIIDMQDQAGALTKGKRDDAVLTAGLGRGSLGGSDLIRIGTAMAGGAAQGGLHAIDRAGREFGAIEDRNRAEQLSLDTAAAKAKGKESGDDNAAQVSSGIVTGLIDEVMPTIDDDANGLFNKIFGVGGNTTGMFGKLLSYVGGSDANNLRAQLDTIRSNVGFDKLQAMREASPTGGALGNVSEKENLYLQSVLGNVDQSQSPEQLKRNLLRLREAYLDIVHGYGNRPSGTPNYSSAPPAGSSDVDDLLQTY